MAHSFKVSSKSAISRAGLRHMDNLRRLVSNTLSNKYSQATVQHFFCKENAGIYKEERGKDRIA